MKLFQTWLYQGSLTVLWLNTPLLSVTAYNFALPTLPDIKNSFTHCLHTVTMSVYLNSDNCHYWIEYMYRRQIIGVAGSLGVLDMVCDYYVYDLWPHMCSDLSHIFTGHTYFMCFGCFILVVIFKLFWKWSRRNYYNLFIYWIHLLLFERYWC